ncbi:MAG: ABC transporter substrate-binding protein, partial [Dongiaceae bacterium]
GENLLIETRSGAPANAGELAAELLRSNVEIIVAPGGMVFGARKVAGETPLVFGINGDPVQAKLVASYSRPGGNLTGITALSDVLSGKRLELLREAAPGTTQFAALANQGHPGVEVEFEATQTAARRLGISVKWLPVYKVADFDAAFDAIAREGSGALVAIPDALINNQAKAVAEFAVSRRIPTMSGWAEFVEAGNLLSYGPSLRGWYRHMSVYADKLLRGAKPADLPVEQPTVFEFVVNLRTAKALGLKVPQSILLRADRVIE